MKFQPKSEKEIAEAGLWEKGDYAFEVLEAEETTSSTGRDMIKCKVKIFKEDGKSQNIFDYLMPDVMAHKLRHICEAGGLLAEYESGEIEAYQLVGKTGFCKVGISVDKTGQYPNRNSIVDYYVDKPVSKQSLTEALKDDVVPFN